jgi:hypothetical protein
VPWIPVGVHVLYGTPELRTIFVDYVPRSVLVALASQALRGGTHRAVHLGRRIRLVQCW